MPETIFLHVGGHRTGTTHFQSTMKRNKVRLAEASCQFHKLHDVEKYRRLAVHMRRAAEKQDQEKFVAQMGELSDIYRELVAEASAEHLLMSYEGHLGSMGFYRSGGLYPAHERITDDIKRMFAGRHLKVGLSIRSYDDFIESTYKFLVRIGHAKPFSDYIATFDPYAMSWVPIVEDLVAKFGSQNVVVWSYEAYVRDLHGFYAWLLRTVTGAVTVPKLKIRTSGRNVGSSKPALEISLQANQLLRDLLKDKALRRQAIEGVNKIAEAVLDPQTSGKPELLSAELKAALRTKYQADLSRVRALAPRNLL